MMRLVGLLSLLVAVWLCVGCGGGGEEEPPDPDSFEDGLTAEEILERAEEALNNDTNTHVRTMESSEVLGESLESITETTVVGEDEYVALWEGGELALETLLYRGEFYVRDPGELAWERSPIGDQLLTVLAGQLEGLVPPGMASDLEGVRLSDVNVDGRRLMRVTLLIDFEGDEVSDSFETGFGEVAGLFGRPGWPSEFLPDRLESEMTFWIGADDFLLYRSEVTVSTIIDDELLMRTTKRTEVLDREVTELPVALPD